MPLELAINAQLAGHLCCIWEWSSTGVISTPRANTTDLGPEVARNITHEFYFTTTIPSHSVPDSSKVADSSFFCCITFPLLEADAVPGPSRWRGSLERLREGSIHGRHIASHSNDACQYCQPNQPDCPGPALCKLNFGLGHMQAVMRTGLVLQSFRDTSHFHRL